MCLKTRRIFRQRSRCGVFDTIASKGTSSKAQASPHFFRRDFNKLEIGQSVGRSIVVAPRGWPSFSFPWFRAGGNERRVNIRLLQMLMVHVGVKNEGIRELQRPSWIGYGDAETNAKIFPDYRLSSAINIWYKTGTYGCFCGFERWRATRCSFKRASVRLGLPSFTEQRIGVATR